jgi:hypothetical protein
MSSSTQVLAFSNASGDAHFVDGEVRFTLTPMALLYFQELARRTASMEGKYYLNHVHGLSPEHASAEYIKNLPCFNGSLLSAGNGDVGYFDQIIHFALLRESLDGLVGVFFSILVGRAMAGDVIRVQLGLELWNALAKRREPITGPLGAMVMDCAHGEYHFKTPTQLGRLINDLPLIAKIKAKIEQEKIKEGLPRVPSYGGKLGPEGPDSKLNSVGIFGGILGFDPNLSDVGFWNDFSLSDFEAWTHDPNRIGSSPIGRLVNEFQKRPSIETGHLPSDGEPGGSPVGHDFPFIGGTDGPFGDLARPTHLPRGPLAAGGDTKKPSGAPKDDDKKTEADKKKEDDKKKEQERQAAEDSAVFQLAGVAATVMTTSAEAISAGVLLVFGEYLIMAAGAVPSQAGLLLSSPMTLGMGASYAGASAAGALTGGGRRMEDPNNPTVSNDDPLLGLWFGNKTAIVGAALKGAIARRGGCYWVPRSPAAGLLDLVGRSAFLERVRLMQANPATDIRWGTEIGARPPSSIDWRAVLRESRRKYEWVAGTVERLEEMARLA